MVVTDGEATYAMYIYNELNWKITNDDPIVIGYGKDSKSKRISVSGTKGAYRFKTVGGIRGGSPYIKQVFQTTFYFAVVYFIYLFVGLFICLLIYLFVSFFVYLFICLFVY